MSYNQYSLNELADMHLTYGECNCNSRAAVRRYAEKFPNRQVPYRTTFEAIDRRFREKGTFLPNTSEHGRPRSVLTPDVEEGILDLVNENPGTSVRRIASQLNISKDVVHRTLKEQQLHPFHVQRVHEILPLDTNSRFNFCNWFRDKHAIDNNFLTNLLVTDESCFTRNGIINLHNLHEWNDENPRATIVNHFQRQFSINVWAGFVGDYLVGPVQLPPRLNGNNYLHFLQNTLPELLEEVPLTIRRNLWFMHDGAPAHFAQDVRIFLNGQYPERWIGRGPDAPVNWPPRSPDLNPLDFYFWSFMKAEVYATPIQTPEELWARILQAAEIVRQDVGVLFRVRQSLVRRINLCLQVNGSQFQHLL